MQNKIYFPVKNITFSELYDWASPEQRYHTNMLVVKPNGLHRQNSRTGVVINCNEQKIAIFRHRDNVYAIEEKCPHLGGPLHLGDIEELPDKSLCVKCPWHSWKFDLRTGKVKAPKRDDVTANVYPVKIKEDGSIFIGFDEFDPKYFDVDFEI